MFKITSETKEKILKLMLKSTAFKKLTKKEKVKKEHALI
jgi:hypothetical protein